jgi:hypothetical protein
MARYGATVVVLCCVEPQDDSARPRDEAGVVHMLLAELSGLNDNDGDDDDGDDDDSDAIQLDVARTVALVPPADSDPHSARLIISPDVCSPFVCARTCVD